MSSGYKVEPGAVRLTAEVFHAEAEITATLAAEFLAATRLPDSAFGNLPISYKLANQYQDFHGQVEKDLTTLHASMDSCAVRLATTVRNYLLTEQANTLRRRP